MKKRRRIRRRYNKRLRIALIVFFAFLIVTSNGYTFWRYMKLKNNPNQEVTMGVKDEEDSNTKEVDSKKILTYSTDRPDETPITNYEVSDNMPLYIHFPTLEKLGYIQQVGIDQNKRITVPSNIYMAGWYVNSVKPGRKGLSILNGHRDGVVNKGIFFGIESLKKGDKVEVKYGRGEVFTSEVKKVLVVTEKLAKKAMYSREKKITNQLNLISCIGLYSEIENRYDKRVVVITGLKL